MLLNMRSGLAARMGREAIDSVLRSHVPEIELVVTPDEASARELARAAAAAGRPVVAGGGDGTVHVVANAVLSADRSDALFGVLPLGSGNDFASNFERVAQGLEPAARALADPRPISIDVGRVNDDELFVNGLGVGFDAEVTRRREGVRVGRFGYFPLIARTIVSYRPRDYHVRWSGGSFESNGLMIAAMNGACEGGGFRITPGARLDDGLLDICWIDPINLFDFGRYALAVRRGTHTRLPMVKAWQTERIEIESSTPLAFHLDGEYRELNEGERLLIEVEPQGMRVIT